jgi:hypothetical protein
MAINNHRLGSEVRPKIMDAIKLPKPVKVALRTKDKVAKSPNELLKWIEDLNPGFQDRVSSTNNMSQRL